MGCDPRCYLGNNLCVISGNAQCVITYAPDREVYIRNYKSVFEQMLKEYNKKHKNEQPQPKTKG